MLDQNYREQVPTTLALYHAVENLYDDLVSQLNSGHHIHSMHGHYMAWDFSWPTYQATQRNGKGRPYRRLSNTGALGKWLITILTRIAG